MNSIIGFTLENCRHNCIRSSLQSLNSHWPTDENKLEKVNKKSLKHEQSGAQSRETPAQNFIKREKNSTCTFAAAEQANSRFFTYGKGPRPSLSKLSETRPEEHMVLLMGNYIWQQVDHSRCMGTETESSVWPWCLRPRTRPAPTSGWARWRAAAASRYNSWCRTAQSWHMQQTRQIRQSKETCWF